MSKPKIYYMAQVLQEFKEHGISVIDDSPKYFLPVFTNKKTARKWSGKDIIIKAIIKAGDE